MSSTPSAPVPPTPELTDQPAAPRIGTGITLMLALACGLTVANLYYAQPLLGEIAGRFEVNEGTAAFVVTLTQVGYVVGLLFVLPLGDLFETTKLVSRTLVITAASLAVASVAPNYVVFLGASLAIGVTSVVAQVLIPYAANLSDDANRGRFVGTVMTGLLLGILLARTVSSLVAALFGWRTIFGVSAVLMLGLAVLLPWALPQRRPAERMGYGKLLVSVARLVPELPALRRRAVTQGLMFGAFSAFWSSVVFELAGTHHLGQFGIGVFALVGAGGAIAAPLAGWLGDKGYGTPAGGLFLAVASLSMVLAGIGSQHLLVLALAGLVLDFCVQGHQVISQREIYSLRADARSRINTVFMSSVFTGGAMASAGAGLLHDHGGWQAATTLAAICPALGFVVWAVASLRTARRNRSTAGAPSHH